MIMGAACSKFEEEGRDIEGLVIKPEGDIPEDRCGWGDTIKMNLEGIAWEVVDWILVAQDGDRW